MYTKVLEMYEGFLMQKLKGGNPSSNNNYSTDLSSPSSNSVSSSSSSTGSSMYSQPVDLPESWSQLLLGGLMETEDRCSLTPLQAKREQNWENGEIMYPFESTADVVDLKEENRDDGCMFHNEIPTKSECNSTDGSALKRSRFQSSSAQSALKVRKEKLGDRITALHQLVSPFGKTDTASVLLESIGYIRFLQSQIEVLSLPYLEAGSTRLTQPGFSNKPKMDLKSRGLCLVPVSFSLHAGNVNGADYWAPSFGSKF